MANPFSGSTEITFSVPRPRHLTLRIYDVTGAVVRTLTDGPWPAGEHFILWNGARDDGKRAATGVYFYRMAGSLPHRIVRLN